MRPAFCCLIDKNKITRDNRRHISFRRRLSLPAKYFDPAAKDRLQTE
jgi:hypothetical protein